MEMPSAFATAFPLPSNRATAESFDPPLLDTTISALASPATVKSMLPERALPTSTDVTPLSSFQRFVTVPAVLKYPVPSTSTAVSAAIASLSSAAVRPVASNVCVSSAARETNPNAKRAMARTRLPTSSPKPCRFRCLFVSILFSFLCGKPYRQPAEIIFHWGRKASCHQLMYSERSSSFHSCSKVILLFSVKTVTYPCSEDALAFRTRQCPLTKI